jgi:hypothetical protein
MSERLTHLGIGLAYFAAWCALAPLCAWLAYRSKSELKHAQAGMPSWGAGIAAGIRWRRTHTPAPVPPRPIIPDPPAVDV